MSTESFTKDTILSKAGSERLEKIMENKKSKKSCKYCKEGIEVETVVIDGCYYTMNTETKYCPYCGRKLGL